VTFSVCSAWRRSSRRLLAVALVGLVVLGIVAARVSPAGLIGATDALVQAIRDLGFGGAALFGILQVFIAMSGILPASLLGVAAGAIYGLAPGFLLAAGTTMAGGLLAFFLSRSLFRPTIQRLMTNRPRLRNFDALIAQDGWRLVCLLRISPIMPFSATSYLLGLSSISPQGYTVGTLASLPALFGYVFIGAVADAGLSTWRGSAGLIHWIPLGIGGVATFVLTVRFDQIVRRAGFPSEAVTMVRDRGSKGRLSRTLTSASISRAGSSRTDPSRF
jgi:uncharacterized membrane protein YdjX (TVP38/TMEM64 family)